MEAVMKTKNDSERICNDEKKTVFCFACDGNAAVAYDGNGMR
jgi:hypothetical protein